MKSKCLLLLVISLFLMSCGGSGSGNSTAGEVNSGGGGNAGSVIVVTQNPGNTFATTTIETPLDNSAYNEGDSITFNGSGINTDGTVLDTTLLVWYSSIDGQIGTGNSLTINTLSPGLHTIRLSVKDLSCFCDPVRITVGQVLQ